MKTKLDLLHVKMKLDIIINVNLRQKKQQATIRSIKNKQTSRNEQRLKTQMKLFHEYVCQNRHVYLWKWKKILARLIIRCSTIKRKENANDGEENDHKEVEKNQAANTMLQNLLISCTSKRFTAFEYFSFFNVHPNLNREFETIDEFEKCIKRQITVREFAAMIMNEDTIGNMLKKQRGFMTFSHY